MKQCLGIIKKPSPCFKNNICLRFYLNISSSSTVNEPADHGVDIQGGGDGVSNSSSSSSSSKPPTLAVIKRVFKQNWRDLWFLENPGATLRVRE